jgi:chemotaxis protein CheD
MMDPEAEVSVVAHVMLPAAFAGRPIDQPGKFADTAVPEMKRLLESMGGQVPRTLVCYTGGAQVFRFSSGDVSSLNIGERNCEAVEEALSEHGFRVVVADVGGHSGRSMVFETATGIVHVKQFGLGDKVLCNLRNGTLSKAA